MREEAGRSPERSDGVLGWGTAGQWARRMPLLTAGLRKGKGEGGMEMLRGSRLGHRALVAPPYHVTRPISPARADRCTSSHMIHLGAEFEEVRFCQ